MYTNHLQGIYPMVILDTMANSYFHSWLNDQKLDNILNINKKSSCITHKTKFICTIVNLSNLGWFPWI